MPQAESSITIERPVDEVFAFIAEGANNTLWRPGVTDFERISGSSDAVGVTNRQGAKGPFGRRIAADYEVTEYEAPSRLAFRVIAGPIRPEGLYTFADLDGSTRVTFKLSWEPRGLKQLLAPMVAKQMAVEVGHLSDLKRVLESRPAAA